MDNRRNSIPYVKGQVEGDSPSKFKSKTPKVGEVKNLTDFSSYPHKDLNTLYVENLENRCMTIICKNKYGVPSEYK
jgi:hypothetical protein